MYSRVIKDCINYFSNVAFMYLRNGRLKILVAWNYFQVDMRYAKSTYKPFRICHFPWFVPINS